MATAGRASGQDCDGASWSGSYKVTARLAGGPVRDPGHGPTDQTEGTEPVITRGQAQSGIAFLNHRSPSHENDQQGRSDGRRAGIRPRPMRLAHQIAALVRGTTCTQGLLRPMWDPDWADLTAGGPHLCTIHAQRGYCQALDGASTGHKSPPVHGWPQDRDRRIGPHDQRDPAGVTTSAASVGGRVRVDLSLRRRRTCVDRPSAGCRPPPRGSSGRSVPGPATRCTPGRDARSRPATSRRNDRS